MREANIKINYSSSIKVVDVVVSCVCCLLCCYGYLADTTVSHCHQNDNRISSMLLYRNINNKINKVNNNNNNKINKVNNINNNTSLHSSCSHMSPHTYHVCGFLHPPFLPSAEILSTRRRYFCLSSKHPNFCSSNIKIPTTIKSFIYPSLTSAHLLRPQQQLNHLITTTTTCYSSPPTSPPSLSSSSSHLLFADEDTNSSSPSASNNRSSNSASATSSRSSLTACEMTNNRIIIIDDVLFKVVSHRSVKSGRGTPVHKADLRNMETGATSERTFKVHEKLIEVRLERKQMQCLYIITEDEMYTFQDMTTWDELTVHKSRLGRMSGFILEGTRVALMMFEDRVADVVLPAVVPMKVKHVAEIIGTGQSRKHAIVDGGMQLLVPTYVRVGDIVNINTSSKLFVKKAHL
eukprot:GHVS01105380.1.p1 GENE.GHVS01105380.1~~GHVS01105380.1.p1  ORF type:complete len:406 (-),score=85.56 GHVS01105380.1:372-1589(-)